MLVRRLPLTDRQRLSTAALSLSRAVRLHGVALPTPIMWQLLAQVLAA